MNDILYEQALEAITKLFGDKSVSQSETKSQLEALIGEIETMIETLADDEGDVDNGDEDAG